MQLQNYTSYYRIQSGYFMVMFMPFFEEFGSKLVITSSNDDPIDYYSY